MSANNDIADVRVTIKIKHVYAVLATTIAITLVGATGWFALKADVAEAKRDAATLKGEVAQIKCMISQQTNYQIYGIKPTAPCPQP